MGTRRQPESQYTGACFQVMVGEQGQKKGLYQDDYTWYEERTRKLFIQFYLLCSGGPAIRDHPSFSILSRIVAKLQLRRDLELPRTTIRRHSRRGIEDQA